MSAHGSRSLSMQDRLLLGSFLRHVVIVLVMLTTIAVALDTASWISRVGAAATEAGYSPAIAILRFLGLRALDNGTQTLPIAAILGFIWTEISYHHSGHRLVDRITGRTEWRAMRAIFLAAIAVAACQTVLDNFVRPFSVQTMIRERLAFWTRYTEFAPFRPVWISTGDAMIEGTLGRAGSSELRDVTYYAFEGNRVSRIVRAAYLGATGGSDADGTPLWRFGTAYAFDLSTTGASTPPPRGRTVDETIIPLDLSPEWLPLAPIKPVYLTLPELARMARLPLVPEGAPNYGSWLLGRLTGGIVVGLLCTFVALFCRHRLERGRMEIAILLSLGIGYGGVLAMRLLRVIGEQTNLAPAAVSAVTPIMLVVLIVIVIRRNTRHDTLSRPEPKSRQAGASA